MQAYLTPGSELAGYRIETLIGRGGMAVIYLAEHLRLGRKVALKLLAPELAEDEQFQQRFLRESRLAAALDHPKIIPIYDAGEAQGLLYIAMRYVAGTDLRALLKRAGRLDPDHTLAILGQVAGALDAAHAHGLVHRDVKPANILLGPGPGAGPDDPDHVYLTDFGITKRSSSASGLTATGMFVGTLDYAAPEQIEGKAVDGRTDVYAMGCVAYESLTGVPPFQHDDDRAVLWAHLVGDVPQVTAQCPDLPAGFDEVVARALAKPPDDRYQTCRAFTDALAAILAEDAAVNAEVEAPEVDLASRPAVLPQELQEAMEHPLASVRAASVTDLSRLLRGRHPGLALAARQALEALRDDDSRHVAALAAAALEAAKVPADPAAAPRAPERPVDAEPADDNAAVAGVGRWRQLATTARRGLTRTRAGRAAMPVGSASGASGGAVAERRWPPVSWASRPSARTPRRPMRSIPIRMSRRWIVVGIALALLATGSLVALWWNGFFGLPHGLPPWQSGDTESSTLVNTGSALNISLKVRGASYSQISVPRRLHSYRIVADIDPQYIDPAAQRSSQLVGVICRVHDNGYYAFGVSQDGEYFIEKFNASRGATLAGPASISSSTLAASRASGNLRLTATCSPTANHTVTLRFFVAAATGASRESEILATDSSNPFPNGDAGVYVRGESGVTATFKSFAIQRA